MSSNAIDDNKYSNNINVYYCTTIKCACAAIDTISTRTSTYIIFLE